ncbi:CHAP domain-containing protein [uncultured Ruminococcus sp.]|uniref:CHAP domain-containing protein n=1 Tax=uncultured Ruminococcus sp. TaxID=165186 RepID=UPI00344674DC
MNNVIKKISALVIAFTLIETGTAVSKTISPVSNNIITANAASYGESIVSAAKSDVGKSRSQVGCCGSGDWCALYATTKAKNAGVDLSYCKYPTFCSELVYDFIQKGVYHSKAKTTHSGSQSGRTVDCSTAYDANYVPKPGDLIFYNWDGASEPQPDHVGIVEYVEGGKVYTIEGNNGNDPDHVSRDYWTMTRAVIHGYASFDGNSYTPESSPKTGYTSYQLISPVEFRNVSYPITLRAGGSFNVYGTIKTTNNSNIGMITVDIDEYRNGTYYNVDRTVRYPNTKSYDLHTIDDRIWFHKASKKNTTYRYRIIVDVNGTRCIHSKNFKTY